jgi:hypothetical protein
MLATGDLVMIGSLGIVYFTGQLGVVHSTVLSIDDTRGQLVPSKPGHYYLVVLTASERSHVFHEDNLKLLSRANKKENEPDIPEP